MYYYVEMKGIVNDLTSLWLNIFCTYVCKILIYIIIPSLGHAGVTIRMRS